MSVSTHQPVTSLWVELLQKLKIAVYLTLAVPGASAEQFHLSIDDYLALK